MNPPEYPTPSQRKTIWASLTALSSVIIGTIAVGIVWLTSQVLGFLQPLLIPFAIAGVMAYLLDPVVSWIERRRWTRQFAVFSVFGVVTLALAGIGLWIIPAIWTQTGNLVKRLPAYKTRIEQRVSHFNEWGHDLELKYGVRLLPQIPEQIDNPLAALDEKKPEESTDATPGDPAPPPAASKPSASEPFDLQQILSGNSFRTALPAVLRKIWEFISLSVGGFLGVFGFLLSMVIVPVYLYYFLIESKTISESWGDYLPIRASAFKDEVVSALREINGYLIAFFRGQLLVSIINGTATAIGLLIVGLDFGLLIGLLLCVLGIIPYLGILLCWIPAVIIAAVQGGAGTWIPGDPWWVFPLVVTGIFVAVQQIDGLFVTPKIVGESVGLHPMTVIVSVFAWSLLMGGLLGAILAVPMTATVKVLLKRYVWERRFMAESRLITEETFIPAESVTMHRE